MYVNALFSRFSVARRDEELMQRIGIGWQDKLSPMVYPSGGIKSSRARTLEIELQSMGLTSVRETAASNYRLQVVIG